MDKRSLERLWDLEEIRDLARRYALAFDTRDFQDMASLFVETPEPAPWPLADRHMVKRIAANYKRGRASTLFVGAHRIEFDAPDEAHGTVYCLAFVDHEKFYEQSIIYRDRYERHDGRWQFLHRDHLLWWGQERVPNPMMQPEANWPNSQIGAGDAHLRIQFPGQTEVQ